MAGPIVKAVGVNDKTLLTGVPTVLLYLQYLNADAAARFLQVFDAASIAAVTLGTTVPDLVLEAGAGGKDSFQGAWNVRNGLVVASTTTATGNTLAGAATASAFANLS